MQTLFSVIVLANHIVFHCAHRKKHSNSNALVLNGPLVYTWATEEEEEEAAEEAMDSVGRSMFSFGRWAPSSPLGLKYIVPTMNEDVIYRFFLWPSVMSWQTGRSGTKSLRGIQQT